jgi:hypothetical protein
MPRILSGNVLEQRPFSRELVACDPTGLTTLTIPLQPDQGVLLLGILIVLGGTRALLPAHAAGVLSMTVDTDGMPPDRAYAIYTRGRFSFRAVTSANPGMVFDELSIAGLKARGIDFEAVISGAPERWISLP